MIFEGFVYSKLHALGTKSEGPTYYLQTYPENIDYILKYQDVPIFEDDKQLHKFLALKVAVKGQITIDVPQCIQVKMIKPINGWTRNQT